MSERETVRCGTCHLNQFMPRNRHCRRCHSFFELPAPVPDITDVVRSNIIAERTKRGWMKQELAQKMSVCKSYISKVEKGKVNPSLLSVERFAHAFGIPAYVLLIPTNKENTQ